MFDLELAIHIAVMAHKGQKDWAGWPYITHPLRLMSKMETEETKILAVLHDVLEDTECTEDDLLKAGMPENLLNSLKLLTRDNTRDSSDYEEYIAKISKDPLARKVKIADLEDNMSITRMPTNVIGRDVPRLSRYFNSWVTLKTVEDPFFKTVIGPKSGEQ